MLNIHQGVDGGLNPYINYPFQKETMQELGSYVDRAHAEGLRSAALVAQPTPGQLLTVATPPLIAYSRSTRSQLLRATLPGLPGAELCASSARG